MYDESLGALQSINVTIIVMLIILACPMAFFYQHNSVSFKWRDYYSWFMGGETEALTRHKDWIQCFQTSLLSFFPS